MKFKRSSGILMHITSLPSAYGIGDFGPAAYEFVDFLNASGQKYWQILPLTPTSTGSGNSPYSSPSAFAGNVLLISPELLQQEGYLPERGKKSQRFSKKEVEFEKVTEFKKSLFEEAFQQFKSKKRPSGFNRFCEDNGYWLNDFSIYTALENDLNTDWLNWPRDLRDRKPKALEEAAAEHDEAILREKFLQFIFFSQWKQLQQYAKKKGIQFIGDLPFYVNHHSADCWAHPHYFKLDDKKLPTMVSGVPPDMFSETGQLWGSPVYDWEALQTADFEWWVERLKQNLQLFDVVRLDHFRAFSAFWEVTAGSETAIDGHWTTTPGDEFFKVLTKEFPDMPFIAEDLGEIDQPVYDLRDKFHLPGMNLLQYAFDEDLGQNQFLPHNHIKNSVVYTGTHDNNTTKGWFSNADKIMRRRFENYAGRGITSYTAAPLLHRLALMSVADLAIVPVQDVLNLGENAIMNRPGTTGGNWSWRLPPGKLTRQVAQRLKSQTAIFGRLQRQGRQS